MAFGNGIGFRFMMEFPRTSYLVRIIASIILEIKKGQNLEEIFHGVNFIKLGQTQEDPLIAYGALHIKLSKALEHAEETLEKVFPTKSSQQVEWQEPVSYTGGMKIAAGRKIAKPRIFIPIFLGTASEYDLTKSF